jgi:hypothetical protein
MTTEQLAHTPASVQNSVDARGRALPMTEDEIRRRNEEAIRGLQALDDMGDEDEQRETLDVLLKALVEHPL